MVNIDQTMLHLLQLPQKAKWNVCRVMEPINLLGLSLCSKVCKSLVKSSKLKCMNIRAEASCITLDFDERSFTMNHYKHHYLPGVARIITIHFGGDKKYKWNLTSFTVRSWIEHVLFVFNRDSINYLSYIREDLEAIQEDFVGLNVHHLNIIPHSVSNALQLLKIFPRVESLGLFPALPKSEYLKVLIQNLYSLKSMRQQIFTLDDLLLCNIAHFECKNEEFQPKELNRLVKLWMMGCNSRLKSIKVPFELADQKEIILRGTNYQDQLEVRTFIIPFVMRGRPEERIVSGGYDVHRKDGTVATLMIKNRNFEMYIWS